MTSGNSSSNQSEPRANDEELFAILRSAEEERRIPALVTSQINELGEFGYSPTQLNSRLKTLRDEGILGHQKASGRHMWWLSSEGDTGSTDLSRLEELVDYEQLDPERFTEEQAVEIAEACISDYTKDWWQRVFLTADNVFRTGSVIFLLAIGLAAIDTSLLPTPVFGFGLLFGIGLVAVSIVQYAVGYVGHRLAENTNLPTEPWGGRDLTETISAKLWRTVVKSDD